MGAGVCQELFLLFTKLPGRTAADGTPGRGWGYEKRTQQKGKKHWPQEKGMEHSSRAHQARRGWAGMQAWGSRSLPGIGLPAQPRAPHTAGGALGPAAGPVGPAGKAPQHQAEHQRRQPIFRQAAQAEHAAKAAGQTQSAEKHCFYFIISDHNTEPLSMKHENDGERFYAAKQH